MAKANSKGGKGNGSGGKPVGGHKGKGPNSLFDSSDKLGSYAYSQIRRAREDNKFKQAQAAFNASNKRFQEAQRKADVLVDQNKKLLRELAEARESSRGKHKEDWDETEEGPEELSEEERRAKIEKVRASLPYLEEAFGAESDIHQEALDELERHQKALREAKPFKTHRTILERRAEKLRRLQEKDRTRLTELQEAADEIRAKVVATAATVAEREREIESTEAELKELVLRAVGEEVGGGQQATVDPQRGWETVVGTVARLVQQPGVPQEVATQIEGMFGQLQAMVATLQAHAICVQGTNQAAAATPTMPMGAAGPPMPTGTAATASSSAAGSVAPPANAVVAEEARRWQQSERMARRQRRSQEAIAEYEQAYKTVQRVEGPKSVLNPGDQQPQQPPLQLPAPPPQPTTGHNEAQGGAAGSNGSGGDGNGNNSTGIQGTPAKPPAEPPIEETAAAAAAAAEAASAAAAMAVASAPGRETGASGGGEATINDSDGETDITGTISEGEREQMEVDDVVSKVPVEQRAGVRALLERRRAKKARQMQRLKKPDVDDGAASRESRKR